MGQFSVRKFQRREDRTIKHTLETGQVILSRFRLDVRAVQC